MRSVLILLPLALLACAKDPEPESACPDLDRLELPTLWEPDFAWFAVQEIERHGDALWFRAGASDSTAGGIRSWTARYDCATGDPVSWEPVSVEPDSRSYIGFSPNGEHLLTHVTLGAGPDRQSFVQVYDRDAEPVGPAWPTLDADGDVVNARGDWAPYGAGWLGVHTELRNTVEHVLFEVDAMGVTVGEVNRGSVSKETFVINPSFGGASGDLHLVWAEDLEDETSVLRALPADGEAFDVAPIGPYDQVEGRPGTDWVELHKGEGPDLHTELLGLDGTHRALDSGFFLTAPDEGGLWVYADAELRWLPEGASEPVPIADEPGYGIYDIVPLGLGRVAVVWMAEGGIRSADAEPPFVQVYTRPAPTSP